MLFLLLVRSSCRSCNYQLICMQRQQRLTLFVNEVDIQHSTNYDVQYVIYLQARGYTHNQ